MWSHTGSDSAADQAGTFQADLSVLDFRHSAMVEISKYQSQFSREGREFVPPPDDRYVAYVDSEAALMLELTANGFQCYGPRALSVEEFLKNIQVATDVSSFELRQRLSMAMGPQLARASSLSGATLTCSDRSGETSVWSLDTPWQERARPTRLFEDFGYYARFVRTLVPDEPSYLKVTIPMIGVTHWADIEGAPNPRSGFLLHPGLFFELRVFVNAELVSALFRSLTVAKLDQEDVAKLINFMFGDQRERNV
jgi:hypothetical protein